MTTHWDAADWLAEGALDISDDTTDEELAELAATLLAEAREQDTEVHGLLEQLIKIRDLELTAGRGPELFSQTDNIIVIKIQAGDSIVRFWHRRLLHQRQHLARRRLKFSNTITLGILHMIRKNRCAIGTRDSVVQQEMEVMAIKNIITLH